MNIEIVNSVILKDSIEIAKILPGPDKQPWVVSPGELAPTVKGAINRALGEKADFLTEAEYREKDLSVPEFPNADTTPEPEVTGGGNAVTGGIIGDDKEPFFNSPLSFFEYVIQHIRTPKNIELIQSLIDDEREKQLSPEVPPGAPAGYDPEPAKDPAKGTKTPAWVAWKKRQDAKTAAATA